MNIIYIIYSSKTGNTEKVAKGVYSALKDKYPVHVYKVTEAPVPEDGDTVLLGFWVDRGNADDATLRYLDSITGLPVGYFGTLGHYPDSAHAMNVIKTMNDQVSKKNRLLGSFLCQGRLDPKVTEWMKTLPADHPHGWNEARAKRHTDAASHPDETDIKNAAEACRKMLKNKTERKAK